jgi:tetratricopeptide (TPR) repeat protein
MKTPLLCFGLSLSILLPAAAAAQEHQHKPTEKLGAVSFPTSCNAQAQEKMNTAVAMLHSFWFPQARKTFEEAAAADPSCGIAYWGVALTHFTNPIAGGSGPPGQAAGWQAAEKAASIGAKSDRDRAYIDAAVALFREHDKVDNRTRMRRYEDALRAIVEKYPADTEAKIFHGIFMVANAPTADLTFAQQKKAAAVLTELYRKHPNHPGLAHYIIHAFDVPPLAHLALDAAKQYADIAPSAPHALHMPSHTFTRLGYWDESIATNRRSADLEPPANKAHAQDYMVYAFLQRGMDDSAKAVLARLPGGKDGYYGPAGALSGYNAVAMPARYALERDDWKAAATLTLPTTPTFSEAVAVFGRALGAARSGDAAAAEADMKILEGIVAERKEKNDVYWATLIEAQRLAVGAWVAHVKGQHDVALQTARAAADMEDKYEKHAVTPGPLIPARELLGDILLMHGKAADALVAYEETLKREPNRFRALLGAAKAAKASGNTAALQKYKKALDNLLVKDAPRRALLSGL